MKIGFDAKRAFNNFTGLGNYSRTVIETLARYYPENTYHLFTTKVSDNVALIFIKKQPSIVMHIPPKYLRKFSAFWRSYFIKNDIRKTNIEIFHGLSHELPFTMPKNVKTVVTIHDLIHERYPMFYPYFDRKIYTLKCKWACKKAAVIVAISEQTKRDIMDFYKIDARKIQVIYQSCHPQFYLTPPQYNSENVIAKYNLPKNYILYIGTINERKNLLNLIKAMQLIDFEDNTHLVVVGNGGAYFKKVKSYVSENNLNSRLLFLTQADFNDFPYFYTHAKAFVLPSFFEGFGIPIIEALWCGSPVITSTGSCFAEAGGAASLYINPHNPESIASAIHTVLTDNALRERMILRGYEYVKRFHEKEIGAAWMALYRLLMS